VATSDQAQALENGVAERHATLCNGMEHAGLDQARRALVSRPADLAWHWPQADELVLSFTLPAGHYATSVLNEVLRTTEPDRHTEAEGAPGAAPDTAE
jgi:tRNA pseudouridine13 synthase